MRSAEPEELLWTLLCPAETVSVDTRTRRLSACRRLIAVLPPGTSVSIVAGRPLSRWRLRRLARRAGLVIERELIVLPSCGSPAAVLDDAESAVRHFWASVATVPPGMTVAALPAALALRIARSLPWSWTGGLAPGRVVVGRRR